MSSARIAVRVTPRSGRDEVVGWRDDELVVRVTAPPEAGKANSAACRLVADAIGVPRGAVTVVRGHASRHKQLAVEGVTVEEARARLGS